jgi:hypothetical protein
LALCLSISLASLANGAKQAATPVNYTDIVVQIAKIASKPNLTWDQVIGSLSHVHWTRGVKPDDQSTAPGEFSRLAEGDITIQVSSSKPNISAKLRYLDGKWQVAVIGSKDNPKIIELVKYYEGEGSNVRLVELINTNEFSIARYKCDFKTELITFGNVLFRVKLKNSGALFLKEVWDCGNRGCTQTLSFFTLDDLANKTECSADLKNK